METMTRSVVLASVVSSLVSAVAVLLVQQVISPSTTTAQSGQLQEVRASSFVLVGPDGTVLGRLGVGAAGKGRFSLYDTAGNQRMVVAGAGTFNAFDAEGVTLRFRAGHDGEVGPAGPPPFSGILLAPQG